MPEEQCVNLSRMQAVLYQLYLSYMQCPRRLRFSSNYALPGESRSIYSAHNVLGSPWRLIYRFSTLLWVLQLKQTAPVMKWGVFTKRAASRVHHDMSLSAHCTIHLYVHSVHAVSFTIHRPYTTFCILFIYTISIVGCIFHILLATEQ